MKKYLGVLLLAAMVLLTACGSIKKVDSSTIYIDKKGQVTSVLVENFAEDTYSSTELETYIQTAIDLYNNEHGKKSVLLDSYIVKKNQARAIFAYDSSEHYENFNHATLFVGTVKEAQAAGYEFAGNFINNRKEELTGNKVKKQYANAQVIILKEPIQVMTEDAILCVSDNTKILETTLAAVQGVNQEENENAQIMTKDYAYVVYE